MASSSSIYFVLKQVKDEEFTANYVMITAISTHKRSKKKKKSRALVGAK